MDATAEAAIPETAEATVAADQGQPDRLLSNLLGKEVTHAGPEVTVSVGTHDDGFYIADDGPGVPEALRDSLFEPRESGGSDSGTGIGLSVVTAVAKAHGWEVTATAPEAGGAQFEITGATVTVP